LVFNVGDAAISIGVVILLVRAFLIKDEHKKLSKESVENA
jgi:lipoprotein signal peptidase